MRPPRSLPRGPRAVEIVDFHCVFQGFRSARLFGVPALQDGRTGPQDCSKTAEEALKRAPRRPNRAPRGPHGASRRPKRLPAPLQKASQSPQEIIGGFLIDFRSIFDQQTTSSCYIVTLLYCYFVTLLLCYFSAGAVAGSQLCCAVDTLMYPE